MRLILILSFIFLTSIGECKPLFFSKSFNNNISSNAKIAKEAESRVGSYFRRGSYAMCAAFVADVVKKSGAKTPPNNPNIARNWLKWGKPVSLSTIKKGDIVVCWRGSRSGNSGHTLIYVGEGMCVHRSTKSSPIKKIQLDYYKSRILGIRRSN